MNKIISIIFLLYLANFSQCSNETAAVRITHYGELNQYYLYNRASPREPIMIYPTAASAVAVTAHMRTNTVVLVHGHGGRADTSLNPTVRDALLTADDVSVIVVDWRLVAASTFVIASEAVPDIAAGLSELLRWFITYNRINVGRLHLVGFDLGAHIVAHTARTWSGSVARITGLDPSGGELWQANPNRLSHLDARYVEVIHTDASGSGLGEAIGHVDIFVNGGINQPGCTLEDDCNHRRAWELFAASLTHQGVSCSLCNDNTMPSEANCKGFVLKLGNNELVKYGNGVFFCETSDKYPYRTATCACATCVECSEE